LKAGFSISFLFRLCVSDQGNQLEERKSLLKEKKNYFPLPSFVVPGVYIEVNWSLEITNCAFIYISRVSLSPWITDMTKSPPLIE
jgi:hypothetical protein